MTMIMSETEVLPKLTTDTESLTFSESCMRSDIANIIKRIYSPRPLVHSSKINDDGAVESRDNIGDNIAICRLKEKENKRFGFYFEPVSRNFAKTIVDSSTTSGSVSMPILRYKPKRLRRVCECCKKKMPYRDPGTRGKRPCRDCWVCRRNGWGEGGNCASIAELGEQRHISMMSGQIKASNYDLVRVHAGASYKTRDEMQAESKNLQRKRSSINLLNEHHGNILKRNNTHVVLDCSTMLSRPVINDVEVVQEIVKTEESSTDKVRKCKVRHESFLRRVVSNLFNKHKTSKTLFEEGERPIPQKSEDLKCARKKSSKINIEMEENKIQQKNKELLDNLERVKSSVFPECSKRDGIGQTLGNKKSDKSTGNQAGGRDVTSEEDINVEKVIIHSCPDLANRKSESKSQKNSDGTTYHKAESGSSNKYEQTELFSDLPDEKYQVAYKGLKIEKDTDWAYEFWGEVFGACHSVVSFFTAFLLHLLTFILQSLIQPLFFGTIRISSDHFFKPCLSTTFESVLQPICIMIESLVSSFRDVCFPLAQCFGAYCKEVSHLCRACRIVEINKNYHFRDKV